MPRRRANTQAEQPERAPVQAVDNPILNSPYIEPTAFFEYREGVPQKAMGRRPASYWYKTERTGGENQDLFQEENRDDLPLVNRLRDDVRRWRESGYRGASPVTRELLRHWAREDRARRLFFCQREAVETVIYLMELRIPGRSTRTGFQNFSCSDEDLRLMLAGGKPTFPLASPEFWPKLVDEPADANLLGLRRLGCKMATGSGKTVVMAMLIAWAFCNRAQNPGSSEFPSGVLVCAPNLTVKNRLQVLRPDDAANYYDSFDLVPSRYKDAVRQGRVLVTNWHIFGKKSPHSEGGQTYSVVDKGEEDAKAFTIARLGELKDRLPILVLNDEGHHCWRPKVEDEAEIDGTREERSQFKHDLEEARVWLDGLDRINNCGLLGENRPCILATIDVSATPFYLGGSGHIEGSPFPWLVSDFGLVDAIESGIVKVPRLPVLQEGGEQGHDEAGRPDPKYFRLWKHITDNLHAGDRIGRRPKPEAVYREAEGALMTLAAQWKQRYDQYRHATATQQTLPPAMIVVCADTDTAELFYSRLSGERREVDDADPKGREVVRFDGSAILAEFSNSETDKHTIRIDSKLLAALQGDEDASKDEKVAQMREMIDTVGKPGKAGEHVRCIVSVSMLTEGWDANNVTQILGVRAFGSQLLCEQVVGRGLRRRSYAVNEQGLLEPEYVDVYGIPFTLVPFKGRAEDEEAPEDKPKNHVRPVSGREALEIRAPRVESYTYDLRLDGIQCDVTKLEGFIVAEEPDGVYVAEVRGYRDQVEDAGDIDETQLELQNRDAFYAQVHLQHIHFVLARRVLDELISGSSQEEEKAREFRLRAKHLMFPQVLQIVQRYIKERVRFGPGVNPKDIALERYAGRLIKHLAAGITPAAADANAPLMPVINRMRRFHTTADAEETTTRPVLAVEKSHLNGVVVGSGLERLAAEALDRLHFVEAFTANSRGFGLGIVYDDGDQPRTYEPDYVVRLKGGAHVLLEIKGMGGELHDPNLVNLKNQAARKWVSAVNNAKRYGRWEFEICRELRDLEPLLGKFVPPEVAVLPFRRVTPAESDRWRTCVPILPLKVAAGAFMEAGAGQLTFDDLLAEVEWAEVSSRTRLTREHFLAQVRGESMSPQIPDGSWCLFRFDQGAFRQGKILLVQHVDVHDPAYAPGLTVKRYRSEKVVDPVTGDWRHEAITLEPLNTAHPPIELKLAQEGELRTVAEFVEVLRGTS
jgi:type III restriction enzyme